jgi:hypothetical protein
LFFYWITERHNIFLRRQRGEPKPWTSDPILQQYKFTNPYRENDRGTVWLRENFLEPHRDDDLDLVAFNICWYRMYNWWGTGKLLGWQTEWDAERIKEKLNLARDFGNQVFTGAHIVYSPPNLGKVEAITDVCLALYNLREATAACARSSRSLQQTFNHLQQVHCVGGFMGYEMVTDMRHTRLLEDATDIMTWANIGPGAARGLRRLQLPVRVESMRGLLERSVDYMSKDFPPLEMREIEHSLCEFDKYARVLNHEGAPRSKFAGV